MTAKEARQKAREANINRNSSQIVSITNIISKAINNGEYSVWFYDVIKDDVRAELTKLGYSVSPTQFDRNETLTKISW